MWTCTVPPLPCYSMGADHPQTTQHKTMTTQTISTAATATPANLSGPVAVPADLLWAAAQFASDDASKPSISNISISQSEGKLRLHSTNGTIAFRVEVSTGSQESVLIQVCAAPFRKGSPKVGGTWELHIDGQASLRDRKGQLVSACEWMPPAHDRGYQFPNIDRLWPVGAIAPKDKPVNSWAFDANRMAVITKVVAKLLDNAVVHVFHHAELQPFRFYSSLPDDRGTLQFLLMPVQVRNDLTERELSVGLSSTDG